MTRRSPKKSNLVRKAASTSGTRSKKLASHRSISICAWVAASVLTWLSIVYLPNQILIPELDQSSQGALSYFAEKQMQFGPEIIYTYGPLGYLVPEIYDGILFQRKLICELLSKVFITLALVWIAQHLPFLNRVLFFCFVWILAPRFGNSLPEMLFYFCIAAAGLILSGSDRWRRYFLAPTLIFLAFVSFIKLTLLVYSAGVIILLSIHWGYRKKWKACLLIPSLYVACLIMAWVIAGQRLTNFPSWIFTSLQVTSGYQQCMGVDPKPGILPLALAVITVGTCLFGLSIYVFRKSLLACIPPLCLAAGYGISWKHGLLRADDHVNLFFGFSLLGFVSFPAFLRQSQRPLRIMEIASGLGCVLCLGGIYLQSPDFLAQGPTYSASHLFETTRNLMFVTNYEDKIERQLSVEKKRLDCPQIKAEVGRATVDVFGYRQAVAILNDLNYHPHPVFQGYSAYTPFLIRTNADFYRSDKAPSYILSTFGVDATIDDRLPSQDDSEALRVLLLDYDFVLTEKGFVLWRRSLVPKTVAGEITGTETLDSSFDQEITVSRNNVWCVIDIKETVLGKFRSLLYKPPGVFIAITDENHQRTIYRLLPSVVRGGFILDPDLLSDDDIIGLKTKVAEKPMHVLSFSVLVPDSSRKYFSDSISIQLSHIPQLASE